MRSIARLAAVVTLAVAAASADDFRLVRSLSGPSGKVDGSKFVLDQVRSRFVYPQDKSFVVYFEWETPLGAHVLTALWKRPDGRVDSISPDVKVEARTNSMSCYWTYELTPEMMPGVWSIEVRIDGQPAGAHSFEIAGTNLPKTNAAPEAKPELPTLDHIFQATSPSMVWVRRFDSAGKRTDIASGFIIDKDRILTALQAVDGASKLEIEFAGGRKVETDKIGAWSRGGDWAVIAAATGDLPPIPIGDPKPVAVGERLIAYTVESGARAIGGIDISGRQTVPRFGDRIQISPAIPSASAGGPLLDLRGKVVGILGGSVMPGTRFDSHHMSVNPALHISAGMVAAATPLPGIPPRERDVASTLGELIDKGILTPPLADMDGLIYVTTSLDVSKLADAPLPRDVCEFSHQDKQVWVTSEWQKRGKVAKGMLAAKVYDDQNRVRIAITPKKVSLPLSAMRSTFSFPLDQLSPGIYRIDLFWNDNPVWRTFIRLTD
jgi:S1-C subfamily serine protease